MGNLIDNQEDSVWTLLGVGDWAFIDNDRAVFIRLPGHENSQCEGAHLLPLSIDSRYCNSGKLAWQWDGNREEPTITPSILCPVTGWHGYLTKGVLVEV